MISLIQLRIKTSDDALANRLFRTDKIHAIQRGNKDTCFITIDYGEKIEIHMRFESLLFKMGPIITLDEKHATKLLDRD